MKTIQRKGIVILCLTLLLVTSALAAWTPGGAYTPAVRDIGVSPATVSATVSANQNDQGVLTIRANPKHATNTGQTLNKFVSFKVEGSFDSGIQLDQESILLGSGFTGWSIDTKTVDNAAGTFRVDASTSDATKAVLINVADPQPIDLFQITATATLQSNPQIRVTKVAIKAGSAHLIAGTATDAGAYVTPTTNNPATITITEGIDPCASVDCGAHGTCSEGTCTCNGGYTGPNCETAPLTCTAVEATCDQAGVSCPGSTSIPATGCPSGQNCANHVCATPSDKAAQKTAACAQITAATEDPTGWTPQWISELAQKLKEIFR